MTQSLFLQFQELVLNHCGPGSDADEALVAADYFLENGHARLAASAYDVAFGLRPFDQSLQMQRQALLNELSVEEHGLKWRYVPAGTFLMGSTTGEPDEQPVHRVTLGDFWITEIPLTWAAYCDLMGYSPPPVGLPQAEIPREESFNLHISNKIRNQYCDSDNWNANDGPAQRPAVATLHSNPRRPANFDIRPMVAVPWLQAQDLADRLSVGDVDYHLPTEAQWEKAARGGLVGFKYAWGNEPPTDANCDFGHFGDWFIRAPLSLPPNGYGIYGMCGGVWEWTQDYYDTLAYQLPQDAQAPEIARQRVVRGGSWSDCADAVTVSFRMTSPTRHRHVALETSPNVGFRLCRSLPSAG